MEYFVSYAIVGFVAQLIDGALGMAYGVISTTLLLSLGFSPLAASTTTHVAECLTTGFSAISHHQFGNVRRDLFIKLLIPGIVGGVLGAAILLVVHGEFVKLFMAIYLMCMGVIILVKYFREFPPQKVVRHLIPLGFFGGFMDVLGGGGWGAIVSSTLLARGNEARTTIGSVNAAEFFVTGFSSLAFFLGGSVIGWDAVAGLAIGGAVAAPIGAYICKYVPHRYLFLLVGILVIALSSRLMWIYFF